MQRWCSRWLKEFSQAAGAAQQSKLVTTLNSNLFNAAESKGVRGWRGGQAAGNEGGNNHQLLCMIFEEVWISY